MGKAKALYNNAVRDPFISLCRGLSKSGKELILDMDWYRWCLSEEEVHTNLYKHPILSKYASFLRIERQQVFKREKHALGVSEENYRNILHEGLNLWDMCKTSIAYSTGEISPNMDNPEHLKMVTDIYDEAISGLEKLKKTFKRLKPDSILICQEAAFESRCIIEAAGQLGINVVGIENSMIGGLIVLDYLTSKEDSGESLVRPAEETAEKYDVSEEQRKEAYDVWERKLSEKAEEHKTGGIDSPDEIRRALDIPDGKNILLLIGQVRVDAAITRYSKLYPDPVDMIERAAGIAEKMPDTILVIKLHPKEISGFSPAGIPYDHNTFKKIKERGIDKFSNVRVVEDTEINTFSLMDMACAGLTITSQAGLEMCIKGKPVMVCGEAFYGRRGFTTDLLETENFDDTIKKLVNEGGLSEEKHKLALDFLYLYCQRHLFDHKFTVHQKQLLEIFLGNNGGKDA